MNQRAWFVKLKEKEYLSSVNEGPPSERARRLRPPVHCFPTVPSVNEGPLPGVPGFRRLSGDSESATRSLPALFQPARFSSRHHTDTVTCTLLQTEYSILFFCSTRVKRLPVFGHHNPNFIQAFNVGGLFALIDIFCRPV